MDVKENSENIILKDLDWKIIKKLKKDSRMPVLNLAREIKTTVSTAMRRIKFLKAKGIIQRFYPIIDVREMGYREYTFISRADPSHNKEIEKFIEYTKSDPRFVIVIKAVGYVNLYYSFLVKNDEELREIKSKIERLMGKAIIKNYKIEVENMIS